MDKDLEIIKIHDELTDCLKVSVQIDHNEVLKVVVQDLIKKRNSSTNKIRDSFDDVLLYYLGDDDFKKYVLKEKGDDEEEIFCLLL